MEDCTPQAFAPQPKAWNPFQSQAKFSLISSPTTSHDVVR
jgi:hypothetical protein